MTSAITQDDLIDRLKNPNLFRYHSKHPFHLRMHAGELAQREFRLWILNRFYYQKNLPIKDAIVLSKLPTRRDRQRWIQRIIDHDGTSEKPGGIEAWLILGESAGISRETMLCDDNIEPGVRFAVDAYVNFCRNENWLPAVASSLTELFAPELMSERIKVIEKHYQWIDTAGLAYFRNRLNQAPRDVDHALELVRDYATAEESQKAVEKALQFKCDVLWSILDCIEQAATKIDEVKWQ